MKQWHRIKYKNDKDKLHSQTTSCIEEFRGESTKLSLEPMLTPQAFKANCLGSSI